MHSNEIADESYYTSLREALNRFVEEVMSKLAAKSDPDDLKRKMEYEWETSFAAESRLLIEYYGIFTCENQDRDALANLVFLFYFLSRTMYDSTYSIDTCLIPWINSIYSEGILQGCECLTGLIKIPAFVIGDILLRTPLSKEDLYYQVDLWMEYIHVLSSHYFSKPSVIKRMFEEIINNCISLDSHKLPLVLSHSLSYFSSPKTGYTFTFINPEYMNSLLWLTALHAFKTDPSDSVSILKSQQILLRYISFSTDDTHLQKHLNFTGNLGLVLGLRNLANSKGEQLLEAAEHRLQHSNPGIKVRTIKSYQVARLAISKTPEELVAHFNSFGDVTSSDLWYAFMRKLSDFGLLNSNRSKSLLVELMKKSSTILLTKEMLSLLLRTICSIQDLEFMIKTLCQYKLEQHFKSTILRKYLQILYRQPRAVKKPHELRYLTKCYLDNLQLHTYLEYARHIYAKCFDYYSTTLIGISLVGEARVDPDRLYIKYETELRARNRIPDELCLQALITGAMNVSQEDITWGEGMFPAQVAVHAFKSNVMTEWYREHERGSSNDIKLYPSDKLWQLYIQLLGKFEYTPELANIIEWWTTLKFTPNETTLKWLLHALPTEYASLYILHMEKVRSDSQKHPEGGNSSQLQVQKEKSTEMTVEDVSSWPWPTLEELRLFKEQNELK